MEHVTVMTWLSFAVTNMFVIQYFVFLSVHILFTFHDLPRESCGNDQ